MSPRHPVIRASGHHLVRRDGSPFFWLADTAWQLFHRLDRTETEHYLRDRATRGFTVIQAVAHGRIAPTGGAGEDWMGAPNASGHVPFFGGDILAPNPDYFAHVDWALERAAHHGLVVALLPIWSANAVPAGVLHLGNAGAYGRWLGDRYADADVVWVLGGDISPVWFIDRTRPEGPALEDLVDHRPVYDELAAGILDGAGGDAFITYHPSELSPLGAPRPGTSDGLGDREWLTMNMIESGHSDLGEVDALGGREFRTSRWYSLSAPSNHAAVSAEYRSTPVRPVVDGETRYEDHPVLVEDAPATSRARRWTAFHVRSGAYHSVFAGAAGHTYGHVSVWDLHRHGDSNSFLPADWSRPDWFAALDAPGADQMRHLKALILSRPFLGRIPDDSIVVGTARSGDDHVSGTRDVDRSWAMVYLPRGGEVGITEGTLSGDAAVGWWFDPRKGAFRRIDTPLDPASTIRLAAPSAGDDWVLVLDDPARRFPAPGEAAELS